MAEPFLVSNWALVGHRVVRLDEARVSILDAGFLYGDGLFETLRVRAGRVVGAEAHEARLRTAADALEIPWPDLGGSDLAGLLSDLVERNALVEGYVRVTLTRGPGTGRPSLQRAGPATLVAHGGPLAPGFDERAGSGLEVIVTEARRVGRTPLRRHKTLSYLPFLLVREDARRRGADEAILVRDDGEIEEATAASVFVRCDARLKTPALDLAILPGIARSRVLDLCRELGVLVAEERVGVEELRTAPEAFVTSSLLGVAAIARIDGRPVGSGRPGPLTVRLREAFWE